MYKSNNFCDILKFGDKTERVTAIIGSGGKTSLMMRLASELAASGRTIVSTSTHIMRPEGIPAVRTLSEVSACVEKVRISAGQAQGSCRRTDNDDPGGTELWYYRDPAGGQLRPSPVCIGTPTADGKITTPVESFEELEKAADYLLIEADGSKRLPLKCHAQHEPVIPENAGLVILVIGLSGIGKKVGEAVHRPEIFEALTGLSVSDTVTAKVAAEAVIKELPVIMAAGADRIDRTADETTGDGALGGTARRFCVFINQADTQRDMDTARELAAGLKGITCYAGSVREGSCERLS